MAVHAQLVLPFHVVADVSCSMAQGKDGVTPIAEPNAAAATRRTPST